MAPSQDALDLNTAKMLARMRLSDLIFELRYDDCLFMSRFYIGTMLDRFLLAHFFLMGGAMLGLLGLILWWLLPISFSLPPFSITAVLALAYGAYCLRQSRSRQKSDVPVP